MFPSGVWRGFWEQAGFGRQAMDDITLHFRNGEITGQGRDSVELFTFHGDYVETTGEIWLTKKYQGRHEVEYRGRPDGEGCILGTWTIKERIGGEDAVWTGPFILQPVMTRPSGEEPIFEIVR